MSLRETLNERRWLGIAIGIGICVLGLALAISRFYAGSAPASLKVFFSDDDGKTWFADSGAKVPPFDHDGKPACRARVYRCGAGAPFLNHLESFPPEIKTSIEAGAGTPPNEQQTLMLERANAAYALAKKPGDKKWLNAHAGPAYGKVVTPSCPDGSDRDLVEVLP